MMTFFATTVVGGGHRYWQPKCCTETGSSVIISRHKTYFSKNTYNFNLILDTA